MKWVGEAKAGSGPAPAARGGHAGVSVGNSCYFFGGADRTLQVFGEVLKCRVEGESVAWQKVSLSVQGGGGCATRTGCSCVAVGQHMYVFAGQEPRTGALFNDVLKVDLGTMTLTRVEVNGGSPPPRHSHSCVRLNDKCLFVFGGAGKDAPLNDSWIFDTESASWTYPAVTGSIPRPREMHSAAAVGGSVVVFGGRDVEGRVLQDLCVLDAEKMAWDKPRRTEHPRCAHTCVPVSLREPVVAGTVVAESSDEEGQRGLMVLGGFSGQHVESSVLFISHDLSSVVDVTDQISGAPPNPSFAHVSLPIEAEGAGVTEAILSFGGINLSEDSNNTSLLSFE